MHSVKLGFTLPLLGPQLQTVLKVKGAAGPTRMPKWGYRHPEEERTAYKIPGLRNKYLGKWQYIVILLMAEPLVGYV